MGVNPSDRPQRCAGPSLQRESIELNSCCDAGCVNVLKLVSPGSTPGNLEERVRLGPLGILPSGPSKLGAKQHSLDPSLTVRSAGDVNRLVSVARFRPAH